MKSEPVIVERSYSHSIEQVWSALTDRDQMKQWYFDLAEFKPEVGFEFQFEAGDDKKQYLHLCKVLEVEPLRKIAYSWRYADQPGNWVVTFELAPEGAGTHLKVTHTGLETFPQDSGDYARTNFEQGWTAIIGTNLPKFLDKK